MDKGIVERLRGWRDGWDGHPRKMHQEAAAELTALRERLAEVEGAAFKVIAYDQLLRFIATFSGAEILFEGDLPSVDAVYDDMVAAVSRALQPSAKESGK